jgi:hypothetical protein
MKYRLKKDLPFGGTEIRAIMLTECTVPTKEVILVTGEKFLMPESKFDEWIEEVKPREVCYFDFYDNGFHYEILEGGRVNKEPSDPKYNGLANNGIDPLIKAYKQVIEDSKETVKPREWFVARKGNLWGTIGSSNGIARECYDEIVKVREVIE